MKGFRRRRREVVDVEWYPDTPNGSHGRRQRARARRRWVSLSSPDDPWRRFWVGLMLLTLVLLAGAFGYSRLGLSIDEALYQTLITISTVGYGEIGVVTSEYRIFTALLIMFGTGAVLYTLGVAMESLFEGRLNDQLRRRRMHKHIDRLNGHVILCGFGQVGRAIYDSVRRAGQQVVVIDFNNLDPAEVPHHIVGDATSDELLQAAGLERAKTLVIALDNDTDNLYVALTARSLCPDLYIVSRVNRSSEAPKLQKVGVDRVVNPHEIGGSRMAAMVLEQYA